MTLFVLLLVVVGLFYWGLRARVLRWTVRIPADVTAHEAQLIIDAQPRDLTNVQLTFLFEDGTHRLSDCLRYAGFYGRGICWTTERHKKKEPEKGKNDE